MARQIGIGAVALMVTYLVVAVLRLGLGIGNGFVSQRFTLGSLGVDLLIWLVIFCIADTILLKITTRKGSSTSDPNSKPATWTQTLVYGKDKEESQD
jgi:hypothetical protein